MKRPAGTFSLHHLLDFTPLEPAVSTHVATVYSFLLQMSAAAVAGCVMLGKAPAIASILAPIATLACSFYLFLQPPQEYSKDSKRRVCALVLAASVGIGLGPILDFAAEVDPAIVTSALLFSLAIFTVFSAAAMLNQRRTYLYLGGILGTAVLIMPIVGLMLMFFHVQALMMLYLWGGAVIFSLYVAYDTQLMIAQARAGYTDVVGHALQLFIDFVGIFRRILVILLKKSQENKQSSRSRR